MYNNLAIYLLNFIIDNILNPIKTINSIKSIKDPSYSYTILLKTPEPNKQTGSNTFNKKLALMYIRHL